MKGNLLYQMLQKGYKVVVSDGGMAYLWKNGGVVGGDPVTAAVGVGVVGSYMGGKAQKEAAGTAARTSKKADIRAAALYAPWREAGERSLTEVERLAGEEIPSKYLPYLEHYITGEGTPFDITTSPAYKYQLEKGTEAIGTSLAARGLYGSGAGIQAETELAERLGVGETEKMYGRLMDLYNIGQRREGETYGRQMDIARLGAGAAGGEAAAATTAGGRLAGIQMQKGATQAGMYSNLANIGMAGVGAYQQQQGYSDLMSRMDESSYRAGGGYGPYQY